jgi:hypothetical protein
VSLIEAEAYGRDEGDPIGQKFQRHRGLQVAYGVEVLTFQGHKPGLMSKIPVGSTVAS